MLIAKRSALGMGLGVSLLLQQTAAACLICSQGTGQEVRQQVIGEHLAVSLLAVGLPFLVTLAVVAGYCLRSDTRTKKPRSNDHGTSLK